MSLGVLIGVIVAVVIVTGGTCRGTKDILSCITLFVKKTIDKPCNAGFITICVKRSLWTRFFLTVQKLNIIGKKRTFDYISDEITQK